MGQMADYVRRHTFMRGFTVIELLIVVVVIAILATITIVAYNGITGQAREAALKSDLTNGARQVHVERVENGSFPESFDYQGSQDNILTYASAENIFCLQAANGTRIFHITETGSIRGGACTLLHMQAVSNDTCPAIRTMAVDARDNRTYWIQKLADGKCWMLTNLAYGGGGVNTYGDVRDMGQFEWTLSNNLPRYYVHEGSNPTTYPTQPSVSIDGGATSPQYGYYYNWCAAMGAQLSTSACTGSATPLPNINISICPAGWRLIAGFNQKDFVDLNNSINDGLRNTDIGLRSTWLSQTGGYMANVISGEGTIAYYWTSKQSSSPGHAINVNHTNSSVSSATNLTKSHGRFVRCLAS